MGLCETKLPEGSRGKLTVELTTSALCDLDCSYCFEGVKTNPKRLEDIDLLIKRLRQLLEFDWYKQHYTGLVISFWGGEPTLNANYVIKIMNEFRDDDRVMFHMYSNGFNRKNMQKIIDAVDLKKFEIQISYDGRPVNDKFRLTKNGKSTADMVLDTFDYLVHSGVSAVYFKSTLPGSAISNIYDTWLDFERLHEKYKDSGDHVKISFAPTLDQTMAPTEEFKQVSVKTFREQMLKVAKKEIEFFKKYNRHLCTWFAAGDSKTNCASGFNMFAVDVTGETFACHGSLYSSGRDEMKSSSIFEDDMLEKISKFADSFDKGVRAIPDTCKSCVATMCTICPVSTYEMSSNEDFHSRWGDRQINGLCDYYQTFGEIDRTVQDYLYAVEEK